MRAWEEEEEKRCERWNLFDFVTTLLKVPLFLIWAIGNGWWDRQLRQGTQEERSGNAQENVRLEFKVIGWGLDIGLRVFSGLCD